MDIDPVRRGRGRPSVVDKVAVAQTAFRLWSEHGFAATGWRELAEATGVSARTLQRHYGTREQIAWTEVEAADDRLAAEIAALPADTPIEEALRRIVVASVSRGEHVRRSGGMWIRLIANEPELAATAAAANRVWTAHVADYLAERLPDAPPAARRAIASAYEAATVAAMTAWAEGGEHGDPATAVDAALTWIGVRVPGGGG